MDESIRKSDVLTAAATGGVRTPLPACLATSADTAEFLSPRPPWACLATLEHPLSPGPCARGTDKKDPDETNPTDQPFRTAEPLVP